MKHHTKRNKFIITFVILTVVVLAIIWYITRSKDDTSFKKQLKTSSTKTSEYFNFVPLQISQPTVTNPDPILNNYKNPEYSGPSYDQPYANPLTAKYSPNDVTLAATPHLKRSVENFKTLDMNRHIPATLPDGMYSIKSKDGDVMLSSETFTPVQCTSFKYSPTVPTEEDKKAGWKLHSVSKGIYMIQKPNGMECLYASIGDSLRSYQLSEGCKTKNVCGLESLDYEKKLDPYSKRTYFEISQYPLGYALRNVENNSFVCIVGGKATFSNSLTPNCYFKIEKI